MPRAQPAMTDNTRRMVPLEPVLADLCRQEQKLKLAGAYAEASGIRDAVTRILRIADAGEPSIEPSEPT
jgi:hypothetical protein